VITYRPLHAGDLPALAQLDLSFETDTAYRIWTDGSVFRLVEMPVTMPLRKRYTLPPELPGANVVAEAGGDLVGLLSIEMQTWNRRAAISHLYVDRSARGRGIGAGLLEEAHRAALAAGARCLWVETQNVNAPAIHFYLSKGFDFSGWDISLYDPTEAPGEVAVFLSRDMNFRHYFSPTS
jgi:ribosomal protein S18 acetylase RimI-like enzyme